MKGLHRRTIRDTSETINAIGTSDCVKLLPKYIVVKRDAYIKIMVEDNKTWELFSLPTLVRICVF